MIKLDSIHKIVLNNKDDFIFNLLEIENFNSKSSRLRFWFDHCKKNINKIDGNIFEFGVFKASSLISMALLLKKLGSEKKIYGFDSFTGFPPHHINDEFSCFELNPHIFSESQIEKHKFLLRIKKTINTNISPLNISSTGDFSDTNEESVREKIAAFELDNIELVVGEFSRTVPSFFKNYSDSIFSCNMDCDLYLSYLETLPHVYNNMNEGSFMNLDEYYSLKFPGARIACDEFFTNIGKKPDMNNAADTEFERWSFTKK